MQVSDIHDYARQLLGSHGDKARAIAAQKAVESDKRGEHRKRRIGGAFVMRSRRCEARFQLIGALRLIGEFALDHLAEDTLHLLEGESTQCLGSTLPREQTLRESAVALSSSAASHTATTSCPPSVQ